MASTPGFRAIYRPAQSTRGCKVSSLQELKSSTEMKFQEQAIAEVGYQAIWHGQRAGTGCLSDPESGNKGGGPGTSGTVGRCRNRLEAMVNEYSHWMPAKWQPAPGPEV